MDALHAIVHVGIIVALSGPIADDQITFMKTETSAIWKPYGVALTWFDADADCASDERGAPPLADRIVWLVSDHHEPPDGALGNVRFRLGDPVDTIHLRYATLSQMVLDATLGSWPIRRLPVPARNQFLGQAMGRVVAHELGHLLLGLTAHERQGLMRSAFNTDDLVMPGREPMRLSRASQRLLAERVSPSAPNNWRPVNP